MPAVLTAREGRLQIRNKGRTEFDALLIRGIAPHQSTSIDTVPLEHRLCWTERDYANPVLRSLNRNGLLADCSALAKAARDKTGQRHRRVTGENSTDQRPRECFEV